MVSQFPLYLIATLSVLGLAPFVLMMITSYAKIIIVTTLVRNALGVQQVPPAMVMNGLAIILTVFIMAPVAMDTYDIVKNIKVQTSITIADAVNIADQASPPLRKFLKANTDEKVVNMLMTTAKRIWPKERHDLINKESMLFQVPGFTITELTKAFQIGFVLYLAFIAIDLIISNILLAMGMMMVSPTTISLPFKLLLFVTLDGWLKISQGLMLSYH
ncbi:type III secretion system export apparatus subunit SctR [Mailhella sp.]